MGRSTRRVPAFAALSLAVVLVAVAGCSDSPVGGPEDQAAGASVDTFCEDYAALDEEFSDPSAQPDPAEIAAALDEIDVPDEIADDFETFTARFEEADELDPNDPEAATRIAEIQEAALAIQDFRTAECDLDAESG
jgi:hypothetical protein